MYAVSAIYSGKVNGWIPNLSLILMLLIFSFAISASSSILFCTRIPAAVRIIIHFLVLGIVYYFLFVVWGGFAKNGGATLVAMCIYLLLYIAIFLICYIIRNLFKKKRNTESKYDSMFKK